jgi:hypothetical protein
MDKDFDALNTAKGILLSFKQQDGENLKRAFSVLVQYEEPEMLELTQSGTAGLFQWFKFSQLGLLVEKRDGQIIEVREKKF